MSDQIFAGDSANVSRTETFVDLSKLLLDPPKESKFKKFKKFVYKKTPQFLKDLLMIVIPFTIVIGSITLICFII